MSVAAHRVAGWDDAKNPGDYVLTGRHGTDETCGLVFICPCGCGSFGGVTFNVPAAEGLHGPRWEWDGNTEAPTLTPSILRKDECRWHGYLTAGEFRSC